MTPASPPASRLPPHGFWAGLAAAAPVVPGAAAFGLVYGVLARQTGLSLWATTTMSILVFAGAAQFTAVSMWAQAGGPLIVLTTLMINLRHLLMGASMAPHLRGQPATWKALLAFGLVVNPGRWGIDLVFPLTFLGLLVPLLTRPVTAAVALASGIVAVATSAWLPGKGNLVLAIVLGSGIGMILEARWTPTA